MGVTYGDLVLHGGIAVSRSSSCSGSTSGSSLVLVTSVPVVGHLRIEFLGGLLGRTGAAGSTTAAALASTTSAASASLLGGRLLLLIDCGRFGLRLGLGDALSQGLAGRSDLSRLGGADHDFNLDRAVVNKQAVQGVESLVCAIRLVEDDGGDAAAYAVGAVGQLDLLNRTDRGDKVLLLMGEVKCQCIEEFHSVRVIAESR
jgi:hypothetical protein